MSSLFNLPIGVPVAKDDYRDREGVLRQALLYAQIDLRETKTAALLVIAGVDGGGKSETVHLLSEWMDPRWIRTHAFDGSAPEEADYPAFWRYWRRLPERGEMGVFLSAWYSNVLLGRVNGGSDAWLEASLAPIRRFEKTLADDGMLIFKLWLHLDADQQAKRFSELEADPLQSWRVTPKDWENWSRSDEFTRAADEIIEATDIDPCRWHVIEASDDHRRSLETGNALLVALRSHIVAQGGSPQEVKPPEEDDAERPEGLSIDRTEPELTKSHYREELAPLQARLNELHRHAREAGIPLIGVFEGRDAAGKGGAIRRVVAALDPRSVDVVRIGAPTDEELKHHYLWRFWRRVPRAGRVTLFDRSWYGRVLAERVDELAEKDEWRRAYDELNDFEEQLLDHGTVLVKFWLEVDRDEQKRRFKDRKRIPHKRWKLTEDDRRNRSKWKQYDEAIAEMFDRTSTAAAPWVIVPANDKRRARITVLRGVVSALEARLEGVESPDAAKATLHQV